MYIYIYIYVYIYIYIYMGAFPKQINMGISCISA